MDIGVHVAFQMSVFVFFGQMLSRGAAGSYGSSVLNFFRNLHTVFPGSCADLHSHEKAPSSTHPLQHLFFLVFLMIVILTGVR